MSVGRWFLTRRWQLTAQLLCGVVVSALFTVVRPLYFPQACLGPVFTVIIIASLAQDQHIGSRLQVTALLLGPTWLAVLLAGTMMTLAKLLEDPHNPWDAQYIAAVSVLSLTGLAVLVTVRAAAPPGPARLMGVVSALMYGIMILLGVAYSSLTAFWINGIGHVVLSMLVAIVVSLLVGTLVAPSLASDEVAALTAEALRGAAAVVSYHISLLMAERQQQNSNSKAADRTGKADTRGDLRLTVRAGPGTAEASSQTSSAPGHHHRHHLWPRHKQQHSRMAAGTKQQHHQHQAHHKAVSQTVDAVTAALAVHRASLDLQGDRGTLDWVRDDPAAPATAVAAAKHQPMTKDAAVGTYSGCDSSSKYSRKETRGSVKTHTSSNQSRASSIRSSASEHSTGKTGSSLTEDDYADLELLQPGGFGLQQQQQQGAEQLPPGPQLTADLLQHPALSQVAGNATAAWVAAVAAALPTSRQASMLLPAASLECQDSLGLVGARAEGHAAAGVHRRSLEYAASLEFQSEGDDPTFLRVTRALSRSKPYGSTASLSKLDSNSRQQQQQQPTANVALSTVSTAGSMLGRVPASPSAAVAAAAANGVHWPDSRQQLHATSSLAQHKGKIADDAASAAGSDSSSGPAGRVASRRLSSFLQRLGSGSFWLRPKPRQQETLFQPHLPPDEKQQQQQHIHSQVEQCQELDGGAFANAQPSRPYTTACDLARSSQNLAAAAAASSLPSNQPVHVHFAPTSPLTMVEDSAEHLLCNGTAEPAANHDYRVGQDSPAYAGTDGDGDSTSADKQQAPLTTAAQLGPIIAAAKVALNSARFEPSWLRPRGFVGFDCDAWAKLLEDAELLLVRVSTLEALNEERRLQGLQLHGLKHYDNMADAMAIILAQLAAFLADVAQALQRQQTNRYVPSRLAAFLGLHTRQEAHNRKRRRKQQQQAMLKALQEQEQDHQQQQQRKGAPSPFASAANQQQQADYFDVQSAGRAPSLSAILSGLERQGSGVSSYLWEKKTGWETGRQLLQHEMEAAVGAYWWAVRRASKRAPVKVPRSREVMILTFVYPICNGLIDASERLEASAQQVLRGPPPSSQQGTSNNQQSRMKAASTAGAAAAAGVVSSCQYKLSQLQNCLRRGWLGLMQREQQWLQPLLKLLLVQPSLQAMKQAVLVDLPTALSSKQNFLSLLQSRAFQAGLKLYLAAGSTLVVTVLLMAYDPRIRSVVPMFGYTSVCLSMQERVEATTDKVVGRVLGTIVGAGMGLAIDHIPGVFHQPLLLLVSVGVACIPLSMIARAQARIGVALAILTLLAVTLCTYQTTCCMPGVVQMGLVDVFLSRMGAVVGACIYVAVLNRILLPWYTSSYALEQMADALEQAAGLFERIYTSQHNRMRLAAVAAGALLADNDAALAAASEAAAASVDTNRDGGPVQSTVAAATAQLAALEAGEAGLHVALRQDVLSRLVAVQMSLAKDSVSWKRGVLATPQVVLDVLGAMIECVEALASQRLALAPFTKQQDAGDTVTAGGHDLLRLSGHCYSIWAAPLHPVWLKTLTAVHELAHETARQLRKLPASEGVAAAGALEQKLLQLETCRLELRHTWLEIRQQLHRQVHDEQLTQQQAGGTSTAMQQGVHGKLPHSTRVWPTDSIHFFTFTYGASRVLNKLTGVTQAALTAARGQRKWEATAVSDR